MKSTKKLLTRTLKHKANGILRWPLALITIAGLAIAHGGNAQPISESTIYSFTGTGGDGGYPEAGLIADSEGNLYGTTTSGGAYGNGAVFELVNNSGTYSERTLYSFSGTDGYAPGSLIMDGHGDLYGTTASGYPPNEFGNVFELVNNAGNYSEKILHTFTEAYGDGGGPAGGLIIDSQGNLYGTTELGGADGYGSVFELVNRSNSYSEVILYSFSNGADGCMPQADLVMDSQGNLYGATGSSDPELCSGTGTVFELAKGSAGYVEHTLYSFSDTGQDAAYPEAGPILDGQGNLYGTTYAGGVDGQGTVYELVNNSGTYSERILHSFSPTNGDGYHPEAALVMDSLGDLFGVTTNGGTAGGYGTVFELINNSGSYSEQVLHSFSDTGEDGAFPFTAGLLESPSGVIYGATGLGGLDNAGTVFELAGLPTPQQGAQSLISQVNALYSQGVLNSGQDNSLVTELQHAIAMMNAGKINGAIGNLQSFITEVNDLSSSGVLSPAQAQALISDANNIIEQLQSI